MEEDQAPQISDEECREEAVFHSTAMVKFVYKANVKRAKGMFLKMEARERPSVGSDNSLTIVGHSDRSHLTPSGHC